MIFAILVFPPIQSYPYFKTVGSAPTGATQGPQEAEPFLCCTFVSPDESLYHNISGTHTYNGGGWGGGGGLQNIQLKMQQTNDVKFIWKIKQRSADRKEKFSHIKKIIIFVTDVTFAGDLRDEE